VSGSPTATANPVIRMQGNSAQWTILSAPTEGRAAWGRPGCRADCGCAGRRFSGAAGTSEMITSASRCKNRDALGEDVQEVMNMVLPVRRNAELQRWDPFRELDDLQQRMSRLLESHVGDVRGTAGWVPAVDVEENDDAFVVEAELPGVKRDDVSVDLQDNELRIHGEIKERERTGILRRQTRGTGQFD
jgi:HSP20 family protein